MQLKKAKLAELLAKCSDKERAFFDRIFPDGPNEDQFNMALNLVWRTVKDNHPELINN